MAFGSFSFPATGTENFLAEGSGAARSSNIDGMFQEGSYVRSCGTFHEACRKVPCAMFHRNIAGMFQEGSYVRTGGTFHGNPHGNFLQASGNGVCCMDVGEMTVLLNMYSVAHSAQQVLTPKLLCRHTETRQLNGETWEYIFRRGQELYVGQMMDTLTMNTRK